MHMQYDTTVAVRTRTILTLKFPALRRPADPLRLRCFARANRQNNDQNKINDNMYPIKMQQRSLSPEVFAAIRAGDVAELWKSPRNYLRPFLPYLVRISSSSSSAYGATWSKQRLLLLSLLAEVEEVNEVKKYLDLDFSELKHDAVKEQQLLHKLHPGENKPNESSVLATNVSSGIMVDYERSGCMRRSRLVLSELLKIMHQVTKYVRVP